MENGGRELGQINARLSVAESEIEKLRDRSHKHAQRLTEILNYAATVKRFGIRLSIVEKRVQWMLGVSFGLGLGAGVIGFLISRFVIR